MINNIKNFCHRSKTSDEYITNERYRFVVFVALVHSDIGDKNVCINFFL